MCVYNLLRNFVCLISTNMFPRKFVDYKTSSCAYSHTKRRVSAHFLTYKNISLRYIEHITKFLSPNFPLMYLKRCTHDFNLQRPLTTQLLTYKTSSRVNFHIGGHACMSISVCHLISYVLSQLSCFHTNVSSTRRVHAHVHRIKDGICTLFDLRKHVYV